MDIPAAKDPLTVRGEGATNRICHASKS